MKLFYEDKKHGIALYQGDCLKVLPIFPDKSMDAVICDLPYGITNCAWDSVIPFNRNIRLLIGRKKRVLYKDEAILELCKQGMNYQDAEQYFNENATDGMWENLKRIIKPNGAIVLFGSQPFTSALVMSNPKMFRYCWVWDKGKATNFMSAKCMPLLKTEDICVFSQATANSMSKNKMVYNPQGVFEVDWEKFNGLNVGGKVPKDRRAVFSGKYKQTKTGYPKNIINISNDNNPLHPKISSPYGILNQDLHQRR